MDEKIEERTPIRRMIYEMSCIQEEMEETNSLYNQMAFQHNLYLLCIVLHCVSAACIQYYDKDGGISNSRV